MDDFTLIEYAAAHALPFDPRNDRDVRTLAKHLKERGYRSTVTKKHGLSVRVWRKHPPTNAALVSALSRIAPDDDE
jgi:hypothetical protein